MSDDCISRQVAIDVFKDAIGDKYPFICEPILATLSLIPSVTPKPVECDDCISRQQVLDFFKDDVYVCNEVKNLPSVNPKPKTDWIPVSEGLPEDGELVLFSTKTDRVFEGRYFADNTDCQWYAFRDECFAWNNVVIAWMPLPTLPKPYKPQGSEISETDTLDKIKSYVDHIRNTGMGKKKSLEFIEKFIEGLKAESEE